MSSAASGAIKFDARMEYSRHLFVYDATVNHRVISVQPQAPRTSNAIGSSPSQVQYPVMRSRFARHLSFCRHPSSWLMKLNARATTKPFGQTGSFSGDCEKSEVEEEERKKAKIVVWWGKPNIIIIIAAPTLEIPPLKASHDANRKFFFGSLSNESKKFFLRNILLPSNRS